MSWRFSNIVQYLQLTVPTRMLCVPKKNKIKQERRPKKEKTVPTRTMRKPLSLSRSSRRRIYEICCMLLYITFEAKQGDQPAETFQATVFSGSTRDRERF